MENYIISESNQSIIKPIFIGWEACERGHSFGPYVREHYIIHFCLRGKGFLENSEGIFEVNSGSFFVIRPGEVTTYTADASDPWEYAWIAFTSDGEQYFPFGKSVFATPDGLDEKMLRLVKNSKKSYEGCLSVIYDLLYRISERDEEEDESTTVRQVRRYIKYNYMLPLTVGGLAKDFGFERSYLYRIFKSRYGVGIKEYITAVRLQMGAKLIKDGYSVGECARLVGYEDRFNFSRAYKAYFGASPSNDQRLKRSK